MKKDKMYIEEIDLQRYIYFSKLQVILGPTKLLQKNFLIE